MYGLIVKLTTVAGARAQLIDILRGSATNMPGCRSYVVAEDTSDENILWVTEVWDSEFSHKASLALPAVRNAIPRAQPLIAHFERVAVTSPVSVATDAAARSP